MLITADAERAACWIAAATLLLPQPDALRASFKIFVADPGFGRHDIIALHPEWAGSWADPDAGLAVFDLDAGRSGPVEPTASARFWVPRFLGHGGFAGYDPYDVVDAVELAAQFAGPGGLPGEADRVAAAVVAAGERLAGAEQAGLLADWLCRASEPVLQIARDGVLDALLDAVPGAGEPGSGEPGSGAGMAAAGLAALEATAVARGWTDATIRLRSALRRAEQAELLAAADGIGALRELLGRPAPAGPAEHRPDPGPRDELEAALCAARPDQVPALLTLADRYRITPRPEHYPDAARRFVRWWLDRPDPDPAPDRWPAPPEALGWVRDELHARLLGPAADAAEQAIRHTWWRPLRPLADDPRHPVDRLVVAAALPHLEPAERDRTVRQMLHRAVAEPPPGEHPATLAWTALFGVRYAATGGGPRVPARRARVRRGAARGGGRTDRGAAGPPAAGVRGRAVVRGRAASAGLGVAARGGRPAHPGRAVRRLVEQLARSTSGEPTDPAELADLLDRVTDPVLVVRAGQLVDVLLTAPHERSVALLRRTARPPYRLIRAVEQRWPGRAGPVDRAAGRAVALSFLLVREHPADRGPDSDELARLRHRLEDLVRELPESARAAVAAHGPPQLGPDWQDWVDGLTSPRRRLLRRFDTRSRPGRRGR